AKYAGAMTHYIADMAVFGHVMGRNTVWGEEKHHSDYESYINSKTSTYHSDFEIFLSFDGELRVISAYDAAVELAYDTTFDRLGRGLTCVWMDENYDWSNPIFVGRVGESLNLAVNYVADVLYTLYVDYKSRLHAKYVRVTFAAVGLEEDADGTIIRVDGVDYGYDDLPLTFEWILGSTHTYEWMEYVYSYEYGKRYVTSMRGGNITILEADLTIIAEYRVQYLWILSAEGLGLDAAGPLILGYSYSDLPLEFWWDKGSTHTIVYPEYVYCRPVIEGKRYANHNPPHLNITVESSGSMRPAYHVEYAVYIASVDGGITDPPPGVYWLDENSTMTVTAIPGEGYVFEKWVGSTEFRGNPLTVVIRSPLRLEPLFTEYFDFSISVKPGEGVARKGENVSTRIDIGLLRGAGNVVLSMVDPPVGISYRLSVKSGSPPLSSTLSIYIGREAKPGVYDLTILAESRDTRKMAIYRLTILESEENWIQQNQILIASLSISAIIIAIILLSRRMKI
ncbi:MAG: hypothetical protein N3E44_02955, partial [Candidatus Bathyarchaeota archaeon]|nr:hypothetical protein [Candidatus Bathyarchaeota archaeon]